MCMYPHSMKWSQKEKKSYDNNDDVYVLALKANLLLYTVHCTGLYHGSSFFFASDCINSF